MGSSVNFGSNYLPYTANWEWNCNEIHKITVTTRVEKTNTAIFCTKANLNKWDYCESESEGPVLCFEKSLTKFGSAGWVARAVAPWKNSVTLQEKAGLDEECVSSLRSHKQICPSRCADTNMFWLTDDNDRTLAIPCKFSCLR